MLFIPSIAPHLLLLVAWVKNLLRGGQCESAGAMNKDVCINLVGDNNEYGTNKVCCDILCTGHIQETSQFPSCICTNLTAYISLLPISFSYVNRKCNFINSLILVHIFLQL